MGVGLRDRLKRGCLLDEEANDFVRGELTPDGIREVEAHLDGCASCLDFVAQLAQALGSQPPESVVRRLTITRSSAETSGGGEPTLEPPPFRGTDRFRIIRYLGSGGMGVVYEAFDREHGRRVALKLIRARAPDSLARFKNEFRSLQDIQHPNLVRMGELFIQDNQWFFTMELVEGVTFLRYVRRPPGVSGEAAGIDESRLRSALQQLTEGLNALHAARKVHRDIKPRNVLVTAEGRLVILDLGLVQAWEEMRESTDVRTAGTVAYMAPEQAASRPAGPPADWYSVGTMLYETLTGRLPFVGNPIEILEAKQSREPPAVESFDPTIAADLASLCNELLRRKPEERPDGAAVLRRLGERPQPAPGEFGFPKTARFIGPTEELHQLWNAFRNRRATVVLVEGESGIGKTELVRRFTEELGVERPDAMILAGRCYERESVAYKAFDGILDALTQSLTRLPGEETESLLPGSRRAVLERVFPVLGRVGGVAGSAPFAYAALDPHEQRGQLFSALRELFTRLSARRPLVLVIDDLQWTDADSLLLLAELMREPDPPAMLLIATLRSGELVANPALRALPKMREQLGDRVRTVLLERLPPSDAKALAAGLLLRTASPAPLDAGQLAEEAHGHPLYIAELIRHHAAHGAARARPTRLEEVLWSRISALDAPTRQLLATVSVAGGPVSQEVAARAVGLDANEFDRALTVARVEHLARTTGAVRADLVECYHDRVRKAVLAHTDPISRREHHQGLALAFEASGRADPETLAAHWRGAGDLVQTARYTVLAADRAARALAFDRAAALYRAALELPLAERDHDRRGLRVRLGDALVNAGRGADAAGVYLIAAGEATATEARELKRKAAEQLLRVGYIDRALDLYGIIGRNLDMPLATTPLRAVASLLYQRARLRLRGLRFQERGESAVAARDLERIDAGFFVGLGLSTVDTVRGSELLARQCRLALDAGEPYRIARALALEAAVNASQSAARGHERTAVLVETAHAIAQRIDQPHALGLADWAAGASAYLEGRWRDGHELNERALATFRNRCTGVSWETASAQAFSLWSLFYLGQVAEVGRRLPALIKEARGRGDLYDATNLRTSHTNIWWLVRDEPDRAAAEVRDAIQEWSPKAFHLQHYYELHALAQCELYVGRDAAAHARVLDHWSQLRRAFLLRVVAVKLEMLFLRARTALAVAHTSASDRRSALALAAADARRLRRAEMRWSTALAALVDAGISAVEGNVDLACTRYADAALKLEAAEMRLHAACARRRHGQLLDGGEGAALVEEAEAWMRGEGVVSPSRMSALIAPGSIE